MREVLIYRTKATERQVYFAVSAILLTVGMLSATYSLASFDGFELLATQAVSWSFVICGWWFAMFVQAMDNDGWCRRILNSFGKEFPYPALEEWADDLEERGEFKVNYESE